MVAEHVFVSLNIPDGTMLETANGLVPTLVKVTDCAALVVPTI